MGQTQHRVLAAIYDIAKEEGLSPDNESEFGNAGTIYVRDGWTVVAELHYDFQRDSATLLLKDSVPMLRSLRLVYSDGKTIEAALDAVRSALVRNKP